MTDYLFDPEHLRTIVAAHAHGPTGTRVAAVERSLVDVYGELVHPGLPWIWSNAGGIMCAISLLHASPREYLLFCGSAIGTEGHSGRHRSTVYDAVIAGELRTYQPGQLEARRYQAGELAALPRGQTNGSKLGTGCWLLEYARGNVPSMFPFALADSVFSTLDLHDLGAQLMLSNRLMARHARLWLRHMRAGTRPEPNLDALSALRRDDTAGAARTPA